MAIALSCVQAAEEQPVPPDVPGQIPPTAVPQPRPQPDKAPVPRLGVAVKQSTRTDGEPGLQVAIVVAGSPAEKSGLQTDDVITHFNDQILYAPIQLEMLVKRSEVGASVRLAYHRKDPSDRHEVDVVLDASTPKAIPSHPEAVLADNFRVTGRVVRVTVGNTMVALSTRNQKAYLMISDEDGIRFESPIQTEEEIPAEMLARIKRVAELREGQWDFKLPLPLPLQPPVQLPPDKGPKAPAPEPD